MQILYVLKITLFLAVWILDTKISLTNQLIKEIPKLQDLRVLEMSRSILVRGEQFIGDLCGMKSLENALLWKEEEDPKLVKIQIEKDAGHGEMKVFQLLGKKGRKRIDR